MVENWPKGPDFSGVIHPKEVHAPAPASTPRDAPWREIEDIGDDLKTLSQQLERLIQLLSGGTPGPGQITVIIPHKATFTTGFQQVYTPGTAQPLNPLPIADGYPVTIVANPNNAGNIYLGKSQSEAQDARVRFNGLAAGLAVSLKIKNLGVVWVDADNANDGVSWIVETDT